MLPSFQAVSTLTLRASATDSGTVGITIADATPTSDIPDRNGDGKS